MRCPSTDSQTYVPPGHFTAAMLQNEAKWAARDHCLANGGGRPTGIAWEVCVIPGGLGLIVSYYCNRPNGHVGRYLTNVAL